MLRQLSLSGFKSWRRACLDFAPLTGLFGVNSSGKSGLQHFLLMLKQTVEAPDRRQVLHFGDEHSAVELGSFPAVVHRHALDAGLGWDLSWRLADELTITDPTVPGRTLFASRDLSQSTRLEADTQGSPVVASLSYRLGNDLFSMSRAAQGYELSFSGSAPFVFERQPGRPSPLPPPVKSYGFPDEIRRFQNAGFLSDFELAFEQLFSNLFYLGPLRESPKRRYLWSGGEPSDVGSWGQRTIDALLAARARGAYISPGPKKWRRTLEDRVAHWLRELGLIHSFQVSELAAGSNLYQVAVRQTADGPEVLLPDVGFGVSQLLPVLVLLYYVPPGAVVLIEQPELHLHPSVQSGLADVFLDAASTRDIQIVVESHSEHLLSRLQRRIAEHADVGPEDVALYFCRMENGESKAEALDVDEFGNIRNWPRDFFGDRMADLAARTRAEAEQKIAAAG